MVVFLIFRILQKCNCLFSLYIIICYYFTHIYNINNIISIHIYNIHIFLLFKNRYDYNSNGSISDTSISNTSISNTSNSNTSSSNTSSSNTRNSDTNNYYSNDGTEAIILVIASVLIIIIFILLFFKCCNNNNNTNTNRITKKNTIISFLEVHNQNSLKGSGLVKESESELDEIISEIPSNTSIPSLLSKEKDISAITNENTTMMTTTNILSQVRSTDKYENLNISSTENITIDTTSDITDALSKQKNKKQEQGDYEEDASIIVDNNNSITLDHESINNNSNNNSNSNNNNTDNNNNNRSSNGINEISFISNSTSDITNRHFIPTAPPLSTLVSSNNTITTPNSTSITDHQTTFNSIASSQNITTSIIGPHSTSTSFTNTQTVSPPSTNPNLTDPSEQDLDDLLPPSYNEVVNEIVYQHLRRSYRNPATDTPPPLPPNSS